jgi:hypothetical protein
VLSRYAEAGIERIQTLPRAAVTDDEALARLASAATRVPQPAGVA